MSIYLIDYYSNITESAMHRISVIPKIVFLFLVLFSIIVSESLLNLLLIFVFMLVLIFAAKLPALRILKWSLYPAFFALLFAFSQIQYGWLPLQTLLRAIDAALLMLFIVCTTPYPAIFSLFGKLSITLASLFFFSYRFFFLLIDELQNKIKIMKIRGAYEGGILRILQNIGTMLGQLFIHSIEKSERLYNILIVRGYKGLMFSGLNCKFGLFDLLLVGMGVVMIMMTVIY